MTGRLAQLISAAEDFLWPHRAWCLICPERSCGEWLCGACARQLDLLRIRRHAGNVRSAYAYRGEAKALVHALKFRARADAVPVLAEAMAEEAARMALPPDTVVTWVPMPDRRRRIRGIDHGLLLARAVAQRLHLPLQRLLLRTGGVAELHRLSARERKQQLIDAFGSAGEIGVPVLLVDDVRTTGTTIRVCADTLLKAGAPRVYAVTATRVLNDRKTVPATGEGRTEE